MSDVKEILDFEIYPRLDRAITVKELNPQDKGSYYLVECPECHQKEAYLYKDSTYINCNRRNKCGYSISLWEYIQNKNQFDNYETLKKLATLANYTLPKQDGYSYEKAEKSREHANIFEAALNYFTFHLSTEEGKEALEYLLNRGYTEGEIEAMELGFYPSQEGLEDYLLSKDNLDNKTYLASEIRDIGLKTTGFGNTYKMTIPYRDPVGRLKGFIVRSLLPENELKELGVKKYKYNWGLKLDTLFNLHKARGEKNLVVVESFLDALIATQRGIRGVVAVGRDSITKPQLENVIRYGVKSFTLCFDNDPKAGPEGTERSLKLINENDLRAYVVTLPDGYKDPDELIKAQGIDAFKELIANAQSGVKWKAYRCTDLYNEQTTDIAKQEALNKVFIYADTINDPIDTMNFMDIIADELEIPKQLLLAKLEDSKTKKNREQLIIGYKEFFREGSRLLEEGKLPQVREYLDETLPSLRAKTVSRLVEPYSLESLQEDILQTREGLKTGYESLDKLISIPQEAITIIAGRPSHGKTTLLLNMFLNMIKYYPEQTFVFFSYEASKRQIGLRLLNILSGEVIGASHNVTQIENYLRGNHKSREKIEKGKEKYKKLTESERLWIIDEPYYVDDLADTLAYLSERHDIGAVFIDYIQKIKIKGRYGTRQIELQKISEEILETAKELSIPIILGAQLGRDKDHTDKVRLDNLREAGDIEQDADLVIGLHNPAMEKAQDSEELLKDSVNLKLTILKNRNGIVNESTILTFHTSTLTIRDKT